jgi:DNA-binding transcriptional LysR family regulator
MDPDWRMDTEEIEVFLALAEELHFGRTAARLRLPQPRVSRVIAALERRVGGLLFERTTRSVRLTPLGEQFRAELRPAHDQVRAAFSHARDTARQVTEVLRIGFTTSSYREAVTRVTEAFEAGNPGCRAALQEVEIFDPYAALRRGEIDVLFNWLALDEPDLTAGPIIDSLDRVLLVARGHPLAGRGTPVSAEELANWDLVLCPPTFPRALYDMLVPPRTPSGRPTRRVHPVSTINEIVSLTALGRVVHPTGAHVPMYRRDDLIQIPICDLPPILVGPIWCTAHENARTRELVRVARTVQHRTPAAKVPGPAPAR